MSCQESRKLIDAYLDGELDSAHVVELEAHLKSCAECTEQRERSQELRDSLRESLPYFEAPDALREKIRAQARASYGERKRTTWMNSAIWRVAAVAASIAVIGLGVIGVLRIQQRSSNEMLAKEVVSGHIRSLMANHLFDVASTDQHTVKPWFNGKLDFAPSVKDLAARGFPLMGGRLDYLDGRPVAALLYRRAQHPINLFLWPVAEEKRMPETFSVRGYNVVHWTAAHMTYWAVSDVNLHDLSEFVRDQRE